MLLGPPSYERRINVTRDFARLTADITITSMLSESAIEPLLVKMAAITDDERLDAAARVREVRLVLCRSLTALAHWFAQETNVGRDQADRRAAPLLGQPAAGRRP